MKGAFAIFQNSSQRKILDTEENIIREKESNDQYTLIKLSRLGNRALEKIVGDENTIGSKVDYYNFFFKKHLR